MQERRISSQANRPTQYKAHFSLWAALKSPLLLGNDLRVMDEKTLSIVNNPAIIALSQDPQGEAATRVQYSASHPSKDEYGIGETQVWSGRLAYGDQVVVFLNAANEDLTMSSPLSEIFVRDGPGGSAPQTKQAWDVYDLWANRMSDVDAQSIIHAADAAARAALFDKLNWYNATATPYADGLEKQDPRLMGRKTDTVPADGVLEASVPRHGSRVFRLRSVNGDSGKRRLMVKDEL